MLSVSFIRSEEYWKMGTKSGGVALSIQHDGMMALEILNS
jgi:hypothetical protein